MKEKMPKEFNWICQGTESEKKKKRAKGGKEGKNYINIVYIYNSVSKRSTTSSDF